METERKFGIKEYISSNEYSFASGVLFVPGASRGAIYDTNRGRVFSLNRAACEMLADGKDNQEFWLELELLGLTTKEKAEERSVLPELVYKPELQFVWFEIISDDCNESCIHCYADSKPLSHRRELGLSENCIVKTDSENDGKSEKLAGEEWKRFIDEAYTLGCKRCQFIGGEPFLYQDKDGGNALSLAEYAKSIGYEFVEIFTNATLLTQRKIDRIKALGISIAVSLYSSNPEIHDRITNTPGSHKRTVEALKRLKVAEVSIRVEIVLMKLNEHTLEQTQEFIEQIGFSHKPPDILRPKGRGDDPTLFPSKEAVVKHGLVTSPNFRTDRETLSRNLSGNSCLSGKITITDSGHVLPCIFSRNFVVGNLKHSSLQKIITGKKLKTAWEHTKDKVLVCQDCEYRYACFDCRPLSESINQGRGDYLSAPYPRCSYNPYTGEWARGVWCIDREGKPYYDESLRPVIEEVIATQRVENVQPTGY